MHEAERNMRPAFSFPGGSRKRILSMLSLAAAVIAMIELGGYSAGAQDASVGPKWEALVTPYLWVPWTDVGVNPTNKLLPSASNTIGFDQLANHLSWVPFMGAAEFRNGPYGIVFDYLHAPLRTGLSTPKILFGSAGVGSTVDTGSVTFLYRAIAQPNQYLDVGAGTRVWGFNTALSLNQGLLPAVNVTSGGAWADPLISLRYHRDLGDGFGATVYGDVGGFGLAANVDWQAVGTIDYAWKSWIDLHAGFRGLGFDFSLPRAGVNMTMYGPILAGTIRF
jgi:hypothetical protein